MNEAVCTSAKKIACEGWDFRKVEIARFGEKQKD